MRTDTRARPAAPADAVRDSTRSTALDRLATVATVATGATGASTAKPAAPSPAVQAAPTSTVEAAPPSAVPPSAPARATAPWMVDDPDGERPERIAPEEVDLAAWADPPWWRRIRWAPDRLAGIALVVLVVGLGAFSVHRLLSTVPAGAPVPELPLATPGETPAADAARTPSTTGEQEPPTSAGAEAEAAGEPVVVAVVGMVARSGLVTLAPGARVADALDRAGGVLDGGDSDGLNLARRVADGEQILVGVAPGPEGPLGPRSGIVGPGTDSQPSAPGAPQAPPAQSGGADAAGSPGLVNINTADASALDGLPGVGPVTAASILAWRDANGPFGSVDQLAEVDGIGPATLARLRPLVTV